MPALKVLGVQLMHPTISKSFMVYDDIVDIIEILFILLLASVIMTALVNTLLTRALCHGLNNLARFFAPCHRVQLAAPTNRPATVLSSDDTKLTSRRVAKI